MVQISARTFARCAWRAFGGLNKACEVFLFHVKLKGHGIGEPSVGFFQIKWEIGVTTIFESQGMKMLN